MNTILRPALALPLLLALLICLPQTALTAGDAHMSEYDGNCSRLDGTMERNYPGYSPLDELSFAFYGGTADNKDLCLTTLAPKNWERIYDLAFLVTELDGMVLEELTAPQFTKTAPLEDCWPQQVVFEDLNGDGHSDILMLVGCYNGEADRPENDNVVYLSTLREGSVWMQQSEDINRRISSFTDPAQAAAAVRTAVAGGPTPPLPRTPQPPPPPPPASDNLETCIYDTEWGELLLEFNHDTGQVLGSYPYNDGRIEGRMQDNLITGVWLQNDGYGNFAFQHNKWGFQGVWNYSDDTAWRGEWNGRIKQCSQP